MAETIDTRYTIADYERLPEGSLYQLIDGELIMSPAPTPRHQRVLRELLIILYGYVVERELGEVLCAPIDVYLTETEAYQPDLIFLSNERLHQIKERNVQGAPDLVVEILSLGNSYYDLTHKKRIYEAASVKEYWIVDPMKQRIEVYENQDGRFELVSEAQRTGKAASKLLEGLAVAPEQIFD
jgi:Uma2 family endonuclease